MEGSSLLNCGSGTGFATPLASYLIVGAQYSVLKPNVPRLQHDLKLLKLLLSRLRSSAAFDLLRKMPDKLFFVPSQVSESYAPANDASPGLLSVSRAKSLCDFQFCLVLRKSHMDSWAVLSVRTCRYPTAVEGPPGCRLLRTVQSALAKPRAHPLSPNLFTWNSLR